LRAGYAPGWLSARVSVIKEQLLAEESYIPVVVFSFLTLYGVISGRSAYQIWMIAFLPTIPYLLRSVVLKILRGRVHELVRDSYDNFVILLYFIMSTLVLWNI
jgi:hypothetical protein